MLTEKCKGCYHNRHMYKDCNACHYSIDTDVLKGCDATQCTHWISKADWCKQNGTSMKMLYKRVCTLFSKGMSLEEICADTGLTTEQVMKAVLSDENVEIDDNDNTDNTVMDV